MLYICHNSNSWSWLKLCVSLCCARMFLFYLEAPWRESKTEAVKQQGHSSTLKCYFFNVRFRLILHAIWHKTPEVSELKGQTRKGFFLPSTLLERSSSSDISFSSFMFYVACVLHICLTVVPFWILIPAGLSVCLHAQSQSSPVSSHILKICETLHLRE